MSSAQPTYRQREAAATRARVTRAARRTFATRGYNATTIAAIARAAGVAIPTVYKLYGNKRALLTEVANAWVRQFAPHPLKDVPSDRGEALAWWAATVRRQRETGLDIAMIWRCRFRPPRLTRRARTTPGRP